MTLWTRERGGRRGCGERKSASCPTHFHYSPLCPYCLVLRLPCFPCFRPQCGVTFLGCGRLMWARCFPEVFSCVAAWVVNNVLN
eukprot:jgi/Botrbrau1/1699/Bobra.116_2s0041.1